MSGMYSNCMMINPDATTLDLQDGIEQRLQQIEAVMTALMLDEADTMSRQVFHNALWVVDELVGEVRALNSAQWEKISAEELEKQAEYERRERAGYKLTSAALNKEKRRKEKEKAESGGATDIDWSDFD